MAGLHAVSPSASSVRPQSQARWGQRAPPPDLHPSPSEVEPAVPSGFGPSPLSSAQIQAKRVGDNALHLQTSVLTARGGTRCPQRVRFVAALVSPDFRPKRVGDNALHLQTSPPPSEVEPAVPSGFGSPPLSSAQIQANRVEDNALHLQNSALTPPPVSRRQASARGPDHGIRLPDSTRPAYPRQRVWLVRRPFPLRLGPAVLERTQVVVPYPPRPHGMPMPVAK